MIKEGTKVLIKGPRGSATLPYVTEISGIVRNIQSNGNCEIHLSNLMFYANLNEIAEDDDALLSDRRKTMVVIHG